MKRSGLLSGATVALELLPKVLPETPDLPPVQIDRKANAHGTDAPRERLVALTLRGGNGTMPLAPLVPICTLPDRPALRQDDAATNMAQQLGTCLMDLLHAETAPTAALYRIALCLAALAQPGMARDILSLNGPDKSDPAALLALRGYLSIQTGETEPGRRALARAAFLSRGVPDNRNILHFTQHVLLSHQFGG